MVTRLWLSSMVIVTVAMTGCQSPYRSDQGALIGGLGGAGLGAIVGKQLGNTGGGAAIGALAGAMTGSVIGNELDEIEARNRGMIEAQLGRQVRVGATSMNDVVAMSQAGVDDELIVTHIQHHGMTATPTADDLIYLKQAGVSPRVVKAMQHPPPPMRSQPVVHHPPPVIVEEHYHGWGPGPYWGPPRRMYHHRRPRPGYSFGVMFAN